MVVDPSSNQCMAPQYFSEKAGLGMVAQRYCGLWGRGS
jgi:hypothetical protein